MELPERILEYSEYGIKCDTRIKNDPENTTLFVFTIRPGKRRFLKKKLGGQFLIATFRYRKGGPKYRHLAT